MTLADVAERLDELDDSQTIFAKRTPFWSASSEALVCDPDDESAGTAYAYLLEVHLAKEAVQVWSEWRRGQRPSLSDKLEAIIYYAEYDAWVPVTPPDA
jgi:hypothetical protein